MGTKQQILGLVVFLAACYLVAGIGGFVTAPAISGWYGTLPRPAWTPPNWLFGPVWTLLYTLMAIAAWLVWRRAGVTAVAVPLTLFAVQLAFNLAWTLLFFGLHRVGLAFLDIVLLWLAILATLIMCWRVTPVAGWLLLPYLLWVSYASTLNFGIWRGLGR